MKHLVVLAFLVLSFTSSAFKWGGYAGATYTFGSSKGIDEIDSKAEFGQDIAFALKQKLLGPLSIEIQLGYKKHTTEFTTDGGTTSGGVAFNNQIDLSYEYIYVRPLIHYSLNNRFSLLGGLTIANTISAENEIDYAAIASFADEVQSIRGISKDFRFAINLGVEMKLIDLGIVDLSARLFYEHTLTDAADDTTAEVDLNSLNLGVAAFF